MRPARAKSPGLTFSVGGRHHIVLSANKVRGLKNNEGSCGASRAPLPYSLLNEPGK
jgi:hypothetical protein